MSLEIGEELVGRQLAKGFVEGLPNGSTDSESGEFMILLRASGKQGRSCFGVE